MNEVAEKESVKIMDVFVYIKKYINNDLIYQKFVDEMLIHYDNDIKLLQESFDKLSEKK